MNAPPNEAEVPLTEIDLLKKYPDQTKALKVLFQNIANLPPDDQAILFRTLWRYLKEQDRYRAFPGDLTKFIVDEKLIEGSDALIDLGTGPGDLLRELACKYPEMFMSGVDLSPGFVENFNQRNSTDPSGSRFFPRGNEVREVCPNARMSVGLIDVPRANNFLYPGNNSSVVSVLTLDRILYPRGLVKNIARATRAKILATLLPVIPEDDNPSRQGEDMKMVYTRPENRIVPGRTVTEDRDALLRVLGDIWQKPVDVENIPYEVLSSGDRQKYDLAVFYSR